MAVVQELWALPSRLSVVAGVLLALHAQAEGDVTGPQRLRIRNGCGDEPIWIANIVRNGVGPDKQNLQIAPNSYHDFVTLDGLASTRYWPKMRCNDDGDHCELGGSGGPGEACVGPNNDYSKCAPPIDTKFEATFGTQHLACDPTTGEMGGCDHLDVSLVDGYTLPFKLEARGTCIVDDKEVENHVLDCSGLTLHQCPKDERLGDKLVDMVARHPENNQQAGCYSPCTKYIDDKWGNTFATGKYPQHPEVAPFCCPTPPEDPEQCRAGPVAKSKYVTSIHKMCPGVYGYSYDDGTGLIRCQSRSKYEVTFFCPQPMLPPKDKVMPAAPEPVPAPPGPAPGASQIAALMVPAVPAVPQPPALPAAPGAPEALADPETTAEPVVWDASGARKAPPAALAAQGTCETICTTHPEGDYTCGTRMKWAAAHRYKNQAQACELALVLVLLKCKGVCNSCDLETSGCLEQAEDLASGKQETAEELVKQGDEDQEDKMDLELPAQEEAAETTTEPVTKTSFLDFHGKKETLDTIDDYRSRSVPVAPARKSPGSAEAMMAAVVVAVAVGLAIVASVGAALFGYSKTPANPCSRTRANPGSGSPAAAHTGARSVRREAQALRMSQQQQQQQQQHPYERMPAAGPEAPS